MIIIIIDNMVLPRVDDIVHRISVMVLPTVGDMGLSTILRETI
jgi:hypothetical protein